MIKALPRPSLVFRLVTGWGRPPRFHRVVDDSPAAPALRFKVDTFAFRNDSRIRHRGKPGLYANWCIVMARAVTQFQRFARFDPDAPRLASPEYTALVRRIVALPPWRQAPAKDLRMSVPGFSSLYELSRDEEAAVKAGFSGRFRTLVHPTNWRMLLPSPPVEQRREVVETIEELRAGRPVQLFITDFPRISLNHSVLVYDYRVTAEDVVEFVVYDPNDAHAPGRIRFHWTRGRFVPAPLIGVEVPFFRAFRIYYSEQA